MVESMGYPVARNLDGTVLTDAFTEDFLRSSPVAFVPTYETGRRQAGAPVSSAVDD